MEDRFEIRTWAGLYGNDWLVVRNPDRRIMTQGSVKTCLRWVEVWSPVLGDKHGAMLSPKAW